MGIFDRFKLRKYQVNPEGGIIFVDRKVEKWLDSFANGNFSGKTDHEIDIYRRITKSGVEEDFEVLPPKSLPKISLVLVTYNSDFWMDNLNKMFSSLADWLYEIIVIDNGSADHCVEKLVHNEIISIMKNELPKSFAAAVNQGCRMAKGDLFLLINPDVVITNRALFSLIDFYLDHPDAAAIVPKLLLLRTPGFINGVGNIVPFFRWGYDLGLGHLDVGQFDEMLEVPSACFAAVLIPRDKWNKVGELDEGYPMYYEDSDWSYRAKGMGFKIYMDINSRVFHSFINSSKEPDMLNKRKLFVVTYGRLRFITKLKPTVEFLLYFFSYIIFDICYVFYSLTKYKNGSKSIVSILSGWNKFINEIITKKFSKIKIKIIKTPISKYSRPRIVNGLPYVKWQILVSNISLIKKNN